MEDDAAKNYERDLRERFPDMFRHPEAKPNELWFGDQLMDRAVINAPSYVAAGLTTVRLGKTFLKEVEGAKMMLSHRPFFADICEYVKVCLALESREAGK